MKVVLDLDRLLAEGRIDRAEYERLAALGRAATSRVAFDALVGLGVVAVAAAALALLPSAPTAILLGLALGGAGLRLAQTRSQDSVLLGRVCLTLGALLFGSGVIWWQDAAWPGYALLTVVFAAAAAFARSGLLAVAGLLSFSALLGLARLDRAGGYEIIVREPAILVLSFAALALACHRLSRRLRPDFARLAVVAGRTSAVLVNLCFWMGSIREGFAAESVFPAWLFALAWTVCLFAAGVWGVRSGRRWLVDLCAVSLAIDLGTQWFEHFEARPVGLLGAGLIVLAAAFGLRRLHGRRQGRGRPAG